MKGKPNYIKGRKIKMAKTKKLLSMALALVMVLSFFSMPASAEAKEIVRVTFANGTYDSTASKGNADPAFVGSVYGKAEDDYSAAFKNVEGDKFFSVSAGNTEFSPKQKLKISYDVASNDFHTCSGESKSERKSNGRYVGMKINDVNTYPVILQPQGYVLDDTTTNFRGTYSKLRDNAWNNVTAIFEFNEKVDEVNPEKSYITAADLKLYVNGKLVHRNSNYSIRLPKKVNGFRVGGILTETEEVYYDNFVMEAYDADDATPSVAFTTASSAKEGNEALIDSENKTFNIENIEMTVAEFKEATTDFVVLGENGEAASDDDYIVDSNVYAVYENGINTYYEPFSLNVEPPVIEAINNEFKEIIDSEAKEIRIVDRPDLTVGEFLENTTGATVTLADGTPADNSTLLSACKVSAVLGSFYNIEYTLIKNRSYAIENETFDGTFTERTSGNGSIYSGNSVTWSGQTNGATGLKFSEGSALGGKESSDKSLMLTFTDGGLGADSPFIYVGSPYSTSKTSISNTFTMEGKLLVNDADEEDIKSIEVVVCGRVAIKLMPDGTVMTTDGTVKSAAKWKNGEWIPFAITLHKATNRINVFFAGIDTGCDWTASPFQNDIRFRPNFNSGASFTLAVDDVKLYTDSLEKYKYTVTESDVTLKATENITSVPVLAVYDGDGKLSGIKLGKDTKEISISYAEGQTVKVMLWESLTNLKPLINDKTVVDRGIPVNAHTAVLSKAFTDNMVLQSDMPVKVWGTSQDENGAVLSVSLGDESKLAYVNDGEWEVAFSAREASSKGETLTVSTADRTEEVKNIAFGDVYFIGGQSNAALAMSGTDTYQADKASFTKEDDIRVLHQAGTYREAVQKNPVSGSKWEYATESTVGKMSAIGIYFANALRESGVDKPIGLISVARSGSSLHWNLPKSITDKYQINYMAEKTNQAYNALMAPVEKFSAKGMLWYQGENDSIKGSTDIIGQSTLIYGDMFSDYHTYLKETTGNDDFKIFSVQLSSHSTVMDSTNSTTGWQLPQFRSYQFDTVKNMEDVYLIPSLDCGVKTGDTDPAHPLYKKPIGERLAKAALYAIYNMKTENNALAPMPESINYEGNTATVTFKNTASGLRMATGTELKGFELIDENGNATEASAQLNGNQVIITNASISEAKGVRYAFYRSAPNTIANLINSEGLPCPTFAHDKGGDNGENAAKAAVLSEGEMLD